MRNKRIPILNEEIKGEYVLITWKMINDFANLTKDYNPIHTDIDYIRKETIYSQPIAHGLIGVSLICALLGNSYNEIILKCQNISFLKPVLLNTSVRAKIKCVEWGYVYGVYKNLNVSFSVLLEDKENNIYISGIMDMTLLGEKL